MHIRDTTHQDEWEVVEEPADRWVDTSVHDMVDVLLIPVSYTHLTLPTKA